MCSEIEETKRLDSFPEFLHWLLFNGKITQFNRRRVVQWVFINNHLDLEILILDNHMDDEFLDEANFGETVFRL